MRLVSASLLCLLPMVAAPEEPAIRQAIGYTVDPWDSSLAVGRASVPLVLPDPSEPAVLAWNLAFLEGVRAERLYPAAMTRSLAMLNLAIYDAVNTIDPRGTSYLGALDEPAPQASPEAAVTGAASTVLKALYPGRSADWESLAATRLQALPVDEATSQGLELGIRAAQRILVARSSDGASAVVSYPGGTEPGEWRPTRPSFRPALSPQWPNVTPFGLLSGAQFRPPPPPSLESPVYMASLEEVSDLGEYFSVQRTEEQTAIAWFWEDAPGTVLPPGHWVLVAIEQLKARNADPWSQARLLALLGMAEADTAIAAWDAKYAYGFWRPITAIPLAGEDGNPSTTPVADWTSLLVTPPHPEYPSGHSSFSGAAAELLTGELGTYPITISSDKLQEIYGLPDTIRSFPSFHAAAEEAGRSRIYGGIHYQFSNEAGLQTGAAVADYLRAHYLLERVVTGEMWICY